MPDIDARTGELFREEDYLLEFAQAVEDVLFTPLGSRLLRRDYGSLLGDPSQPLASVQESVDRALPQVTGVDQVDYDIDGNVLNIVVNNAIIFDVAELARGGTIRFGGESMKWRGQEVQYGF